MGASGASRFWRRSRAWLSQDSWRFVCRTGEGGGTKGTSGAGSGFASAARAWYGGSTRGMPQIWMNGSGLVRPRPAQTAGLSGAGASRLRENEALSACVLSSELVEELFRPPLTYDLLELGAVARNDAHAFDGDVDHVPRAILLAEPVVHLRVPGFAADDARLNRRVAERLLAFSEDDHLLLAKLPDSSAIAHRERALELVPELLALLRI